MFYMFRTCGIRLSHSEMYTSESCSDVFISPVDVFGLHPQSTDLISVVIYDRACDLHPFIKRLSREGNTIATNFEYIHFMIDDFHVQGHKEPKCDISSPQCMYHPGLAQYSQYKGMNAEVAEQSFSILNLFKCSTRKMTLSKRLLFFKFLDDTANTIIEGKINKME